MGQLFTLLVQVSQILICDLRPFLCWFSKEFSMGNAACLSKFLSNNSWLTWSNFKKISWKIIPTEILLFLNPQQQQFQHSDHAHFWGEVNTNITQCKILKFCEMITNIVVICTKKWDWERTWELQIVHVVFSLMLITAKPLYLRYEIWNGGWVSTYPVIYETFKCWKIWTWRQQASWRIPLQRIKKCLYYSVF